MIEKFSQKRIYMDYAATTPILPYVADAVIKYMYNEFGNPSSLHYFGIKAREIIENTRNTISNFLNVEPENIIFTSGGTESDNLAIQGIILANYPKKQHIITSQIEHSAVYNTCLFLKKFGHEVSFVSVNEDGLIDLNKLEKEIKPNTSLISVHYANNEIGTIQPIKEIGEIAQNYNIAFHTDAVQAFCKIKINIKDEKIMLLSGSGHKIYALKGAGFLYIKNKSIIQPIIHGGPHEFELRAGTENVLSIASIGKAIEFLSDKIEDEERRLRKLSDKLINSIFNEIDGVHLNGSLNSKYRLPNIINLRFDNVNGYDLMLALDREGIACSTGSACHSSSMEPSRVLLALGLSINEVLSSIRISIGYFTKEEDIEYLIKVLKKVVNELRKW